MERPDRIHILERRALHQAVFENHMTPIGSFPDAMRHTPSPLQERFDRELDLASRIIVYSEIAKASYVAQGHDPEKIRVTPLGTGVNPPDEFELGQVHPRQLLYVGRGSVQKGLDLAVDVVEGLGSGYRLIVAGFMPPNVQAWLQSKAFVTNVGHVPRHILDLHARNSALLLAPSMESFGLAALDAAANGIHVLGSSTTGLSEWLPDRCGTFIDGRDPAVWKERAAALLEEDRMSDPTHRHRSATLAATLNWENAAISLAQIYAELTHD